MSRSSILAAVTGAVLVVALLLMLSPGLIDSRSSATSAVDRPNVVIVLADTVRADHLSLFGYPRDTSPHLSELATRGAAFGTAVSQAPYTSKSIEALFTGDLPSPATTTSTREVPEWRETLAERFAAAGYQTAGFSGNPLVSRATGHAQGFEDFEMESLNYRPAPLMFEAALSWLDTKRDGDRPFFLYVHCMDAHAPYAPPTSDDLWRGDYAGPVDRANSSRYVVGIREQGLDAFEAGGPEGTDPIDGSEPFGDDDLARLVSLYDGAIHFFDRVFAAFFNELETRDRLRDTVIVLVADHGEEFMEHGSLGHGRTLFDHQVRVPLMIWGPGVPQNVRIDAPVAVADVMPTLLELAAIPRTIEGYGQSLRPLWSGTPGQRSTVATLRPSVATPLSAVRSASAKLVRDPNEARLYDLTRDPAEQHPLRADPPSADTRAATAWLHDRGNDIDRRLERLAERVAIDSRPDAPAGPPASPMLSDEIEAQLKALGYATEH